MKWLNLIIGLGLIGFALLILFLSAKLGIGNPQSPGAGFMPFIAAVVLLALTLLALFTETKEKARAGEKKLFIRWESLRKPAALAIVLCGYSLVLQFVGFLVSTFLLIFSMLSLYDPRKWPVNLLFSALVSSISFFVFCKWLGVQLPKGLLHIGW